MSILHKMSSLQSWVCKLAHFQESTQHHHKSMLEIKTFYHLTSSNHWKSIKEEFSPETSPFSKGQSANCCHLIAWDRGMLKQIMQSWTESKESYLFSPFSLTERHGEPRLIALYKHTQGSKPSGRADLENFLKIYSSIYVYTGLKVSAICISEWKRTTLLEGSQLTGRASTLHS